MEQHPGADASRRTIEIKLMAVANHNRKFVFLCEPHTASRACAEAILRHVKHSVQVEPHHARPDRLGFNTDGYTFIAAVRNPFDVFMTKRLRPSTRQWPMGRFLDERWDSVEIQPSYRFCYRAERVVWYETLLEDLQTVFDCPEFELTFDPKHATPDKPCWQRCLRKNEYLRLFNRDDFQEYMQTFGYHVPYFGDMAIDKFIHDSLCRSI